MKTGKKTAKQMLVEAAQFNLSVIEKCLVDAAAGQIVTPVEEWVPDVIQARKALAMAEAIEEESNDAA